MASVFALSLCTGLLALPLLGFSFDLTGDFDFLFHVLAAVGLIVVLAALKAAVGSAGLARPGAGRSGRIARWSAPGSASSGPVRPG